MTNTDTADIDGTVAQVKALARAGSELVRVTVNNDESAAAVPHIRERLDAQGINTPLVGDFHFNGHKLLKAHPACAEALGKLRINPGNVGRGSKRDSQFAEMIETAVKFQKPVRIGVNWGSLDQDLLTRMMDENSKLTEPLAAIDVMREAIVVSALDSAKRAESLGLGPHMIVISAKVSGVQDLIAVYRNLAGRCAYPLHLGLTEAGMGSKGIVASTAAMGVLLQEGIGDTIRVSLTPEPNGDRTQEVIVAQEILQTMGLRAFTPMVIACPGCGRTTRVPASARWRRCTRTARRPSRSREIELPRSFRIWSSATSSAPTPEFRREGIVGKKMRALRGRRKALDARQGQASGQAAAQGLEGRERFQEPPSVAAVQGFLPHDEFRQCARAYCEHRRPSSGPGSGL